MASKLVNQFIGGQNNKQTMVPSETTGAVVSDYFSYGSFSGADIKVVVHYPHTTKAETEILKKKNELLASYNSVTNIGSTQDAVTDTAFISTRDTLVGQIESLDEELKAIRGLPTSKVLGELQTISGSIFRRKNPVRRLGSTYVKSYTRGSRTIAGSMVFTIFHQHVLHEIMSLNLGVYNTGTSDYDKYTYSTNLIDQLPPLDLSLIFANEYGAVSHMAIFGVEFFQEGFTFSIEDIFSESVVQYTALDLDPMRLIDKRQTNSRGITNTWSKTATQLTQEQQVLSNHLIRRDTFI